MRTLVSLVRRILIGPSLDKLSRLTEAELTTLKQLCTEDPIFEMIKRSNPIATPPTAQTTVISQDQDMHRALQELKQQSAALAERVEVLERLLHKPQP